MYTMQMKYKSWYYWRQNVLCCAIGFGAVILIPVQYRHDGYHGREHLSEFLYRDVLRCYRVRENVR